MLLIIKGSIKRILPIKNFMHNIDETTVWIVSYCKTKRQRILR